MINQVIGIAGVFVLTFLLIGLRHVFLILSQPSKRPRIDHSSSTTKTVRDLTQEDSWLLWAPESENGPDRVGGFGREAPSPDDFGTGARPSIHNVK